MFSLRALFEVAALRLIVHQLGDADIERFDEAMTRGKQRRPGPSEYVWSVADDDLRFHEILFELCSHGLLP